MLLYSSVCCGGTNKQYSVYVQYLTVVYEPIGTPTHVCSHRGSTLAMHCVN